MFLTDRFQHCLIKHAKTIVLIFLAVYLFIAFYNSFMPHDSIDEYAYDYWSTALSMNLLHPITSLRIESSFDRIFGYLGFIPDGHFVYNISLKEISQGKHYFVVPMINFVPIYVYAIIKYIFGFNLFYFTHMFLLLGGIFAIVFIEHKRHYSNHYCVLTAVLLLSTPVLSCNMTYAMPEDVGIFGISLFLVCLHLNKHEFSLSASAGMIIGTLMGIFYKPIGWVFLPWASYFMLYSNRSFVKSLLSTLVMLVFVGFVALLSQRIYGSALLSGYKSPLNQMLSSSFSQTTGEHLVNNYGVLENPFSFSSNVLYGIPTLIITFPMFIILAQSIYVDLLLTIKNLQTRKLYFLQIKELVDRIAFISPIIIYFIFLIFYNHENSFFSYFSLLNPTFRYILIPYFLMFWYIIIYDIKLYAKINISYILLLHIIILSIFPGNLIQRIGLRAYEYALKQHLTQIIPANSLIMGSSKYIKLFVSENIPTYALFGHRLYGDFDFVFTAPRYCNVFGTMQEVIQSIYKNGYVPVCIFPDIRYIDDSQIMQAPPSTLNSTEIGSIDFKQIIGIWSWLIPPEKRHVIVYRVIQ